MRTIHLDLSTDATRRHIKDELFGMLDDPAAVDRAVAAAGVPEGHNHDVGAVFHAIDGLSGVSERVRGDLRGVYDVLAHAEAQVHGVPVEKTHFHEVGDAVALRETLAVCLAVEALAPDRVTATPVQLGSGKVQCAHGLLDIPAPATKAIVDRGIPVQEKRLDGELCTPTSAAIVWHFVDEFDGDDRRHLMLTDRDVVRDLDRGKKYGLAFSGGVDSSLILAAAARNGVDVKGYTVASAFQATFELDDARRLAEQTGAELEVVPLDAFADDKVCSNPADRCYWCKRRVFGAIRERMEAEGREVLLDGTNATDDPDDRPGMKALGELGVVSPLRDAGFTKADVRRVSGHMGLFTSTKAKFSCFATKVPAGQRITQEAIDREAERLGLVSEGHRADAQA